MSSQLGYAETIRLTIATDIKLNAQLEDSTYLFDATVLGIVSIAAIIMIKSNLEMKASLVGIEFVKSCKKIILTLITI